MSAALQPPIGLDDFLAWEREQERRYEVDGLRAVAMTDGSLAHQRIGANLVRALDDRLRPPCRAFPEAKVVVTGRVRYPDAVVTCAWVDMTSDIVPEPVVVFEVVSPGKASVDHVAKNEEYRQTTSIARYVMLEQDRIGATVFAREAGRWTGTVLAGPEAILALPELRIEAPLSLLYSDLDLPAAQ